MPCERLSWGSRPPSLPRPDRVKGFLPTVTPETPGNYSFFFTGNEARLQARELERGGPDHKMLGLGVCGEVPSGLLFN